MHWYNPTTRVAETVSAPCTDEEAEYILQGGTDSWAFVAEYGRLRGEGMGVEQAMIFLGTAFGCGTSGTCLSGNRSGDGREMQDVRSEQARLGKMVRARGDRHEPELRGVVGSVLRCYGEPEYLALEVITKEGRSRVFWHHEVEELEA